MMSRSGHRIVAATVLLGFMMMSTACYGPFNLTKNVYHWNSNVKGSGEVSSKWMREIMFFGMFVLPVYEFSALLDAFIFNSIHFWTGDSPIKASAVGNDDAGTKVVSLGGTTIRWNSSEDGATVTYEQEGVEDRRATIVSHGTGYRLIDEHNKVLSEAEYAEDGSVQFRDGTGLVMNRWSREQLRSIAQRW
jgi:hypothetical protein